MLTLQPESAKILIIEDNALNREMLLKRFLKDKYDILTAENGEIGFEILRRITKALSRFTDMMPVCDGTEF